jgi:hypothetical protein
LSANCGDDGTIRLWDPGNGQLVRMLVGDPVVALWWSKDGKVLSAAGRKRGEVQRWDAETGRPLGPGAGVAQPAATTARSPDGKQTAVADHAGVGLHDAGGERTYTLEQLNDRLLTSLAWSPDSRSLALRYQEGRQSGVVEVDAATGQQRPPGAVAGWQAAAQSPDGRTRAILEGNTIHLDDANGFPLGVLLPFDTFGQLAVSADGHYRGSARVEREIRMVVQKPDGSSETLTPAEFEQKYGFKNEPEKVRLLE